VAARNPSRARGRASFVELLLSKGADPCALNKVCLAACGDSSSTRLTQDCRSVPSPLIWLEACSHLATQTTTRMLETCWRCACLPKQRSWGYCGFLCSNTLLCVSHVLHDSVSRMLRTQEQLSWHKTRAALVDSAHATTRRNNACCENDGGSVGVSVPLWFLRQATCNVTDRCTVPGSAYRRRKVFHRSKLSDRDKVHANSHSLSLCANCAALTLSLCTCSLARRCSR
jgi:hypothetical protein